MLLRFSVTKEHFVKFTQYAVKRLLRKNTSDTSAKSQQVISFFITAGTWLTITLVSLMVIQYFSGKNYSVHWPTAVVFSAPLIFIIGYIIYTQYRYASVLHPTEGGLMTGDKSLTLDAEGITEVTSLGSCYYKWQSVEAFEENSGEYYIFVDKLLAVIVPEEALNKGGDKEEFVQTVCKYSGVEFVSAQLANRLEV